MESVAWASNWAVNPATQCSKCLFSRSWHRFILLLLFFDAWYIRELLRFSLFPCNDYTEHIQIYVHFRRIRRTLYIRRPSPLSYRDTNKAYIADHFRHKCHRFLHQKHKFVQLLCRLYKLFSYCLIFYCSLQHCALGLYRLIFSFRSQQQFLPDRLSQYHQNVVFLSFLSNRHLKGPDGFNFLKIFLISINTILYIATMLVELRFPRMLSFFSCFTCNKSGTILQTAPV